MERNARKLYKLDTKLDKDKGISLLIHNQGIDYPYTRTLIVSTH